MRELRQNPRAAIERARAGETVLVTMRGETVAQITKPMASRREQMIAAGQLTPATESRLNAPRPRPNPGGPSLSDILREMREAERY